MNEKDKIPAVLESFQDETIYAKPYDVIVINQGIHCTEIIQNLTSTCPSCKERKEFQSVRGETHLIQNKIKLCDKCKIWKICKK